MAPSAQWLLAEAAGTEGLAWRPASAPLRFLAEVLILAAESIKKEFLFHFYSFFVGAQLMSLGMGIPGPIPGPLLQLAAEAGMEGQSSW